MVTIKSPGGSIYPYYYKGGEVHCLKYGSYFKNHDRLIDVMKMEEEFIKKSKRHLRIWVDFYDTEMNRSLLLEFVNHLIDIEKSINKLTIVGLPLIWKWKLNQLLKKLGKTKSFAINYFSDPEDAKTWIVAE